MCVCVRACVCVCVCVEGEDNQHPPLPPPTDMIDLESKFEVLENEVKEINTNKETLKKNLLDLIELQHILDKTRGFFQEVRGFLHCVHSKQACPL